VADQEVGIKLSLDGSVFVNGVKVSSDAWKRFGEESERAGAKAKGAGEEIKQSGEAANAAARNYESLGNSIGSLVGKMLAAVGIAATLKAGLSFNSQIEDATVSMGAMIASQNDIRDGFGNMLTGASAFNAAMDVSKDQLKKLQIAGVNTTATFSELTTVFRGILAPAQQAGLNIDQARQLTISMTQAANALNVPMAQVEHETRAILTGTIRQENQLARNLGMTNESVKALQQSGKLMDVLNEKTRMFAIAGEAAAKTWTGMLAGLKETITQFAGGITEKLGDNLKGAGNKVFTTFFDQNTMEISGKLTPLISALNSALGSVGGVAGKAMTGLLDGAMKLGGWIEKNKEAISGIGDKIGIIWDKVTGIGGAIATVVLGVGDWLVSSGALEVTLQVIGGLLDDILSIISDTVDFFTGANNKGLTLNATIGLLVVGYGALIAAQTTYNALSEAGFTKSIGSVGKLKLAFSVLAAAMIGWEIGTILSEKFAVVRAAGHAMIGALVIGWEELKYEVDVMWTLISGIITDSINGIKIAFGAFLTGVAEGLKYLPNMSGAAADLKAYGEELMRTGSSAETTADKLLKARDAHMLKMQALGDDFAGMIKYEMEGEKAKEYTDGMTEAVKNGKAALEQYELQQKKSGEAAAAAARQAAEEWQKFLDKVKNEATLKYEDENGVDEEFYKTLKALDDLVDKGKITWDQYTQAVGRAFDKTTLGKKILKEANDEVKEANEAINEVNKGIAELEKAREKATETLENELEKLKFHNDTLGLNAEQTEKVKLALMEKRIEQMKATFATNDDIAALEKQISLQKQLVDEAKRGRLRQEELDKIKEIQKEGEKAADQINQALTDAIMRGFENGKSFAQNFRDSVMNLFKTMVLRPIVQFAVQGGQNLVASLLGGLLGGGSGNNGGGLLSMLGNNGSNLSSLISLGQKGYGYLSSAYTYLSGMFGSTLSTSGVVGGLTTTAPSALAYVPTTTYGYAGIGNLGTIGSVGSGVSSTAPLGEVAASVPATTTPAAAATPAAGSGGTPSAMSGLMTNPYTWMVAAIVSAFFANKNMYDKGWRADGQYGDMDKELLKHAGISGLLGSGGVLGGFFANGAIQLGFDKLLQNMGVSGKLASWITGSSLWTRFLGLKNPQMREGGVEGMLSLDGFDGRQFQDVEQAGGFLRSGRHWTEWDDIDPDLKKMIDATIGKVPQKIDLLLKDFGKSFAEVFGEDWEQKFRIVLTTDGKWENMADMFAKATTNVYREMATTAVEAIREGWGQYVEELKDLEPDDFQAKIVKIVGALSILDNVKGTQEKIFGVYDLVEEDFEKYAATGEKIYETISRLATTFTLTNKISDFAGIKFSGVGLDSATDRQDFVDEAGGVDALTELFNSYFAAFSTPSEQLAAAFEPIRDIFDQIGVDSIPRTTQAFRDLVAAQDMSTAEGRQAAQQLMAAADLWKQSAGAFEQMKQNLSDSIDNMRKSFELDGLSNDEKYKKIKAEGDAAYVALQSATDPYEIQKLLDTIRTDMSAAWGLLTDDQKNAQRSAYLAKLDELESMGLSRIDVSADQYLGAQDAATAITDAGDTLADSLIDVANEIRKPLGLDELPPIDRKPIETLPLPDNKLPLQTLP